MNNNLQDIDNEIAKLQEQRKQIKIDTKENRWQEVLDAKEMFTELLQQYLVDYEGIAPSKEPLTMKDMMNMGMDLYGKYETALGVVDLLKMFGGGK